MRFRVLFQGMVTADGERFGRASEHWFEVPIDAKTKTEAAERFSLALARVAASMIEPKEGNQ